MSAERKHGSAFRGEAPGRIDFMGGVADYSGSLVLEMPIHATTCVTIRPLAERRLRATSHQLGRMNTDFGPFLNALRARAPEVQLRGLLDAAKLPVWSRYLVGCLLVFCDEKQWLPAGGIEFEVKSSVPQSMGVSSSAALEIATLRALAALAGVEFSGTELARLGQRAENRMVGAPCGLMDQLTSAYGKLDCLLPILCRPDVLRESIQLPNGVTVVGWPSGVKHAVSGSHYVRARCAAFMGKALLEAGLKRSWSYASEITPELFAQHAATLLPSSMTGRQFLDRGLVQADPISKIDPHESYPVRDALRFPIEENARCARAATLLRQGDEAALREAGRLLGESHAGYNAMGLGATETDRMVEALMAIGPAGGIYGGRISGGGSGGTVVVLLQRAALPRLEKLTQKISFAADGPLPLIS